MLNQQYEGIKLSILKKHIKKPAEKRQATDKFA